MGEGGGGGRTIDCTFGQDLAGLLFRDTLDLLEDPARCVGNGLDSVETTVYNQLDVALGKAGNTLRATTDEHGSRARIGTKVGLTSRDDNGVGAPGPVILSSPTWLCASSSSSG